MKRAHVDNICIGDKFRDDYGDVFEIRGFHGATRVFCMHQSHEDLDYYGLRDNALLKKINDFEEKK